MPAYAIAVRLRTRLARSYCGLRCCADARAAQVVIALVAAYAAKVLLLPERKKQARTRATSTLRQLFAARLTGLRAQS